ncbi:PLDc N-terminal domain-containing protein [Pontibacter fetidus]|uniref:Cardiolipin synthase N-terminal domain-containing protein n=1 Tax=Pontibacter fetidus TaxID=2700082 RepID=A0A6B2H8A6_9BACT|nr:hypothetical protein [Pontibacter fetidus]
MSADDLILYFTVGIALCLYIFTIWDIYRKDFSSEWSRTIFLALVMLFPIGGMVLYTLFSNRFLNQKED